VRGRHQAAPSGLLGGVGGEALRSGFANLANPRVLVRAERRPERLIFSGQVVYFGLALPGVENGPSGGQFRDARPP